VSMEAEPAESPAPGTQGEPRAAPWQAWELGEGSLKLGHGVTLLLWAYSRASLAYDLALVLIGLVVLLVPGGFWGDPLWRN
jgi:hypothetical protein